MSALSGCGEAAAPPAEAGIPVPPPEAAETLPPLEPEVLRELLDIQNSRDGAALAAWLRHPEPAVRARAALAAASVQDPALVPELARLLDDQLPAVRRDAAFALGQVELPDGGRVLFAALAGEPHPEVRGRILEALGKRGGEAVLEDFRAWEPAPEDAAAHALALARLGIREVGGSPAWLPERLAEALLHETGEVRKNAAYYFGRHPSAEPWEAVGDRVRAALDRSAGDDPAAMHLLMGVARLRDRDDLPRVLDRLRDAEDWRVRVSAARVLGAFHLIELPGVREALWDALENDPAEHVAIEAARVLNSAGLFVPQSVTHRGVEWIRGDPDRWRTHVPFLANIQGLENPGAAIDWLERMAETRPEAAAVGMAGAIGIPGPPTVDLLIRLAEHEDPRVQGSAVRMLGEGWPGAARSEEEVERLFDLFAERAREGHPIPAVHGARALAHPLLEPLGAVPALMDAYRERADGGEYAVVRAILAALGEMGDPEALTFIERVIQTSEDYRVRRAAGEAREALTGAPPPGLGVPDPERRVDIERLAALGSAPRLVLETERGEIVVRLAPDQAPLTVQTIAELAGAGRYDGVPFHRVVANFVVQGGDFSVGDGSGTPGFRIRSEFTRIPFRRGVIGMASSGKDTESSQFFLTHSAQPHLDGGYTAFGWVESGAGVMDRLLEGERIVSARVEPGEETGH